MRVMCKHVEEKRNEVAVRRLGRREKDAKKKKKKKARGERERRLPVPVLSSVGTFNVRAAAPIGYQCLRAQFNFPGPSASWHKRCAPLFPASWQFG